jgi:cytochrome c5
VITAKLSVLAPSLFAVVLGAVLFTVPAGAAVKDEIAARLQPAAKSCVFGEDCAAGMKVPGAAPEAPKTPDVVYNTYCQACHASGANKAPIYGKADEWAPRIAKGMDALYESAIKGFNNAAMPARGTCVSCSDDEIKATVDYMAEAAKAK